MLSGLKLGVKEKSQQIRCNRVNIQTIEIFGNKGPYPAAAIYVGPEITIVEGYDTLYVAGIIAFLQEKGYELQTISGAGESRTLALLKN